MTRELHTCDDCGRTDLTPLGVMLCCSPLNNNDDLNN